MSEATTMRVGAYEEFIQKKKKMPMRCLRRT